MKKRVFGMLLAVAMVLSVLTVGVSAEASAAEGYYVTSEVCYVDGSFSYSNTYTYDSYGNVLTKVYLSVNGTTSTIYHSYTYDSNGKILSETVKNNYSTGTDIYSYTYDSSGNLTKKTSDYYTYTYTYDSNGNLTEEDEEDGGILMYITTYTYDSEGRVKESVLTTPSGSFSSTDTYTYDSSGKLIKKVTEDKYGTATYTYTYDSNGNCKKMVEVYDAYYDWDESGTYTYTYTYNTLAEIQSPFTDVKDETKWYFDAVIWAVNDGITAGTSDTTFSPNMDCSRAQIVTFLWRAAGSPEPTTTKNPFTDVKKSAYYYKAVLWAVENGITAGTSSTTFSPDKSCTRAEAVTFLYRYEGSPSVSTTSKFTDVGSTWYTNAVAWAVKNGITAGTTKTTFSPNTTCSRAMIVTFLYRDLAD